MAVIIPCAGRSSRFPGTRPKYLLTLYDGDTMFERAAKDYPDEDIHFIILKEHKDKYDASEAIYKAFKDRDNIFVHVLPKVTSGPAETVYTVTKHLKDQPILIRDCDSFFDVPLKKTNHVCLADLRDNKSITNVAAKSYAVLNDQDFITNIVEKTVVSNYICVGGYGFESSDQFNSVFERQSKQFKGEIFISHIIKDMLHDNTFEAEIVQNYIDCGTYEEFVRYNQSKPTIFCDLDGTVFYNQSRLFANDYSNPPKLIPNAVKYLLSKQQAGSKIVFTTSRPEEFADQTITALNQAGFEDITVLFNVPHAPRMVINDNSKTNPYPTALAMNVPRDDDEYWSKLL